MSDENPIPELPRIRRLTPQEEIFAQAATTMSHADAYRLAYNTNRSSYGWTEPSKVAWRPHVAQRILELQSESSKTLKVGREWLIKWHWDRMVYDPAEITAWAVGPCRHCHGAGHGYQWRENEFMEEVRKAELAGEPLPDIGGGFGFNTKRPPHPDCPACDGKGIGRTNFTDTSELSPSARAAFEGIKQTRDGFEIKMADKNKAAENFAKLCGYDVQQVRLFVDELPDDAELAAQARDADAISATYKRFFGPALTRH